VFVSKLNSNGQVIWSTFLGGPNYDRAYAIEVDREGYVYVGGRAGPGYPTTRGSVQPVFGGDRNPNSVYGPQDGFVTKLSPDGSKIVWSTYFGADDDSIIRDIAIDQDGNVYLASAASRPNRHVTGEAFQPTIRGGVDGLIAKITGDGAAVLYATYLGGSGDEVGQPSIRVDETGHAYVLYVTRSKDAPVTARAFQKVHGGMDDLLLAKFSPDGRSLMYSTYFGGSSNEAFETHNLSLDTVGNAFITASTNSANLPVTEGAFQTMYGGGNGPWGGDGFVAKISADGSMLLASTYFGGSNNESVEGSVVDSAGHVYVTGSSNSTDFPVTLNGVQRRLAGNTDFFGIKLSSDLKKLIHATYLGGSSDDVGRAAAIDSQGSFYVAGMTQSTNFPVLQAFQKTLGGRWDGALVKLSP
jgi:hypothetical protein